MLAVTAHARPRDAANVCGILSTLMRPLPDFRQIDSQRLMGRSSPTVKGEAYARDVRLCAGPSRPFDAAAEQV